MAINIFEPYFNTHKSEINDRNYVRLATAEGHWFSIYENKLSRYITRYGDRFNLIIRGLPNVPDDFYIIPFKIVKHFFLKEYLSRDKETTMSTPRWVGSIIRDEFAIRGAGHINVNIYRGRLELIQTDLNTITFESFKKEEEERERAISILSSDEILNRIKNNNELIRKQVVSTQYVRDPYVATFAKRVANGKCELCNNEAPFCDRENTPYLEVHHIKWLSRGGEDSIDNVVALCPNCHKKMHIVDSEKDVQILESKIRYRPTHQT